MKQLRTAARIAAAPYQGWSLTEIYIAIALEDMPEWPLWVIAISSFLSLFIISPAAAILVGWQLYRMV